MKKYIKILIGAVIVTAFGFFIWEFAIKGDSAYESETETFTDTVQRGEISNTVSASGTIETSNMMAITTSVNGVVKELYVAEGETVVEGQKIMEIELDSEGEESLTQAWASYLNAQSSLENAKTRLLSLESTKITAEEAFEDEKENNSYQTHDERVSYSLAENTYLTAVQEYDNQLTAIEKAESSLQYAWYTYQANSPTVTAPTTGIISNIIAVEGVNISNSLSERTSFTVASIKTEGNPLASLNITEMDINSVQAGQKVTMTLSSIDDQTFTGTVAGIDKIGTTSSGVANYPVYIQFDTDSELILPNMSVDADIIIESVENALYVTSNAITTTKNGSSIVVVNENGEQETKSIEIGISDGTNTQVISGLEEGETIIVPTMPTSGFDDGTENMGGMGGGMGGMGGMMR